MPLLTDASRRMDPTHNVVAEIPAAALSGRNNGAATQSGRNNGGASQSGRNKKSLATFFTKL
jgi:hypothetical protein